VARNVKHPGACSGRSIKADRNLRSWKQQDIFNFTTSQITSFKGKGHHRNVTVEEQKERRGIELVNLSLGKGLHCP